MENIKEIILRFLNETKELRTEESDIYEHDTILREPTFKDFVKWIKKQ